MNHKQTQQHGLVIVGAISSDSSNDDASSAAAVAEVSSSSSGGGGGSSNTGGSDITDTSVQDDPHQILCQDLVRCITRFPVRVVGVHSCGASSGEDSTSPSFTDLLSKATSTTVRVHSGNFICCWNKEF